jgi:hypothetical protein
LGFRLAGEADAAAAAVEGQSAEVLSVADARSLKSGSMAAAAAGKPLADEHGICSADGTLCNQAPGK